MKIIKWILLFGLILSGCTSKPTESKDTSLNVLCPSGAPTLAFLSSYEEITANGKFEVVDGSDLLVSELSKEDSEYDVIVAPINVGTQLLSKGATTYRLDSVLTWGNLYVVGTEGALEQEGTIDLFGEGAVPQKIYETVDLQTNLTPSYLSNGQLVQADLLSGKVQAGLLAEPLVTATIQKAQSQGLTLSVLADLQELYSEKTGTTGGYPQAAIFVKEGTDISSLTSKINEFTSNGYPDAKTYLEKIGTDTLGLPAAGVVVQSMERQNVRYVKASEVTDQITAFLKLFNITFQDSFLNA